MKSVRDQIWNGSPSKNFIQFHYQVSNQYWDYVSKISDEISVQVWSQVWNAIMESLEYEFS